MINERTTERLRLRQWTKQDFDAFAAFFASPQNTQFVGGTKTPEEAWRLMASYIGHHQLYGYSYMAVAEKATNQLVGTVGIWNTPQWPEPELGYWFLPEGQGQGYAYEAASALKQFALEEAALTTLVSFIAGENEASKKLAIKLGAKYDGVVDLLSFGPHGVYRYR